MSASLVGSEMCIRDRLRSFHDTLLGRSEKPDGRVVEHCSFGRCFCDFKSCLLYTSDAADDM
eukprot:5160288-Alexandrium_andersonii.AAC.1